MSNTPMEIRTNLHFIRAAHGSVLIGGLGLGVVLREILKKEEVTEVLVVEKYPEVINLVLPQLIQDKRLTVVQGDILEYKIPKGKKFNTIYFDIWNNITSDNVEDMKKLHRRFIRRLDKEDPDCYLESWREWDCRDMMRRNR